MNEDGTEPAGPKILTVWAEEDGYHIDSMTREMKDPLEWGEALADVALHLAHAGQKMGLSVEKKDGVERVTVDDYVSRLMDGFLDRIKNPPTYTDGGSRDAEGT